MSFFVFGLNVTQNNFCLVYIYIYIFSYVYFCRDRHLNKDQMSEFSFENENQPVCSSVSSFLALNTSSIFMSSLSSLINAIFIIVSRGSQLLHQELFCVFKMRIVNKER